MHALRKRAALFQCRAGRGGKASARTRGRVPARRPPCSSTAAAAAAAAAACACAAAGGWQLRACRAPGRSAFRKAEPRPVAEQRRVTEPPRALLSGCHACVRRAGGPGVLLRRPWLLFVVSRPLVRFEMVGKRLSAAAGGRLLLVLHQSCQLFDGSRGDGDMHARSTLGFPVVQVQYFAVSIGRTWENLNSGGAAR